MSLHDERLIPPHVLTAMEKRPAPYHFKRDAWVDPAQHAEQAMADTAEEIRGLRAQLADAEAYYERLRSGFEAALPRPRDEDPPVDARVFPSTGTEAGEAWR